MKIMISQPMAGKEYDEVLREREKTARKLEAMGHTVVDTVLTTTPPADDHVALFYLSCALNWMSQCDGFFSFTAGRTPAGAGLNMKPPWPTA